MPLTEECTCTSIRKLPHRAHLGRELDMMGHETCLSLIWARGLDANRGCREHLGTYARGEIRLDATAKRRFDEMQRLDSSAVVRFLISLGPLV